MMASDPTSRIAICETAADEAHDLVGIAGGARHQVASVCVIVKRERERLVFVVQLVAQVICDALREPFGQVAQPEAEQAADQRQAKDQEGGIDEELAVTAGEPLIDRLANQLRHDEG